MIKKQIPNTITLLNLLCGCLSIYSLIELQNIPYAVSFIFLGAIFDFFDGMVARLLKVQSPLGIQLDSLADVVTFGVAPGFLAFYLLKASCVWSSCLCSDLLPFVAFLIPMLSAYRLGKFNIDKRQTTSFIGLPTPANALFWCGIALMRTNLVNQNVITDFFENPLVLTILVISFSILLVAEIPLFSLKFKNFKWSDNKFKFIFLGLSIILFCFLQLLAISFVVLLYIILSLANNLISKKCEANNQSTNNK